jgi:hypothetical protein
MIKVLAYWKKADWMSDAEVCKEVKRFFHTAISFGATLEVIDADGSLKKTGNKFSFLTHKTLRAAVKESNNFVLLEPVESNPGSIPLRIYEHKEDATYVIWSEYGTTPYKLFPKSDRVSIPTLSAHPLWAVVATGVVLYDRMIKWQ